MELVTVASKLNGFMSSIFKFSCGHATTHSSNKSMLKWIGFYLLAPCPQYAIITLVHLFLLAFVLLFIQRAILKSKQTKKVPYGKNAKAGKLLMATILISAGMTLLYIGLEAWMIWTTVFKQGKAPSIDIVFTTTQTLKWFVFVTMVGHERKFGASVHPFPLRVWWVIDFILSCLLSCSGIARIATEALSYDSLLMINDISALASLPAALLLLVIAIRGRTGVQIDGKLTEHLLNSHENGGELHEIPVKGYADANFLSKATWMWLTPLLEKGYKKPLQVEDVPELAYDDRAEQMLVQFRKEWPERPGPQAVRLTLFRCFRRKLFLNGVLAFIRLCVMYVGPALIQRFVDYTSGDRKSPSEGYYLVLILLGAKVVEGISSHQFNFMSQKLGMLVRATIVTTVYQKGLNLSSSARQAHGVGEIVNYMVVDAQQLSDLMLQINNLWVLPAQVCVALALLYGVIGLPMLAGFAVLVIVSAYNFHSTRQQRIYQGSLMVARDQRMKATSEVLNFMKIIKFQAWEDHFLKRLEDFRNKEYDSLSEFMFALARNILMLWVCTTLVALVTFGVCILSGVELTPGTVFTATATFRVLQEPIRAFPQSLISLSQSLVSLERLDKFMVSEELDRDAVVHLPAGKQVSSVTVEAGNFTWEDEQSKPVLQNININIKRGSLVTIVGTVGSGKSSLLTAVLGEMRKLSGTVSISGSTAYVSQIAWIQNCTIQENILFGQPLDLNKYKAVLRACALEPDLELMEFGDQTEIGERGINLSGGQKQRIQLARAVYQDSDIYLLDDVFSAVDAHTGSHLFQECILGALKNKTVLLVTHQVEFLHRADRILVMREGVIVQTGKYKELLDEGADLEALVAAHDSAMESITLEHTDTDFQEEDDILLYDRQSSVGTVRRSLSRKTSSREKLHPQQLEATSKLIDEEKRESGRVGWRVYWLYCTKAYGWPMFGFLILTQVLYTIISVLSDYFLADSTSHADFNPVRFIEIYFLLCVGCWVCVAARTQVTTLFGLKTAQTFYFDMLRSIFRTPMSFFDTTPSGRIISRSSTDQASLDVILPFFTSFAVTTILTSTGTVIVTCQVTWPIIFLLVPLIVVFLSYQAYFIATSRELTRLDSVTKAPVIFQFSETLAGLVTIRAFKKERRFSQMNIDRVDTNIRMDFHNNGANEWLGFRLELIGTVLLCGSALLLVSLPATIIRPDRVGLSLSYGLSLNASLFFSVYVVCMVENKMVSVERIRQYVNIESEAPRIIDNNRPPPQWPMYGAVSVVGLQLRYRPNTPLVLKGVNLNIRGGEKVGVVGRTGSGKSTLVQAFFRLVEPCGGEIIIDGIDITKIGLADLRSRFGIIPQEPILFEGNIRSNVDPLDQYNDHLIWEVLRRCQLADIVQAKGGLESSVVDNGDNWSVGQKQLFCLGRALLRNSRILFLDEATASVDAQTDGIIQKTIRDQFASSTVISVAHRIPSVMDSDKVLVMGEGKVREYDSPSVLLERTHSLFAALVREYTSRSAT